ncbi:hypothetical protein [Saccharomonospora cyanea]|uniref:Uncharacterized protein n=1 Tax=Saccharomonospora cyanea NA-134 TaxID=882082 RepID=H5XG66_9PSEU|nr:hypothetical protein [Saccharomonospora cyanea]EHR62648.1 hypothetical protein SaccyDRAFT_3821 [Saccharomonospora cyanea NA-134]
MTTAAVCLPGCRFADDLAADLADRRSPGHVCVVRVATVESVKPRPVVVRLVRYVDLDGTAPVQIEVGSTEGMPIGDDLELSAEASTELAAALSRAVALRAEVSA